MKKTILVTSRAGIINFSIIQYFYQKNYNVIKAMKKKILNQEAKIELLKKKKPSLQSVKKNEAASLIYYLSSKAASQITDSNIPIDGAWTSQ